MQTVATVQKFAMQVSKNFHCAEMMHVLAVMFTTCMSFFSLMTSSTTCVVLQIHTGLICTMSCTVIPWSFHANKFTTVISYHVNWKNVQEQTSVGRLMVSTFAELQKMFTVAKLHKSVMCVQLQQLHILTLCLIQDQTSRCFLFQCQDLERPVQHAQKRFWGMHKENRSQPLM